MEQNLTSKKLEYLYFLYLQKDEYVKQVHFSKLFNVTKVTVNNFMTNLESDGYIEKNEKKSIRISEKGEKAIKPYTENIKKLTEWFCVDYDIPKPQAITEAVRFLMAMDDETVKSIIKKFEWQRSKSGIYNSYNIKDGEYSIDFTVYNKDESKTSMGNNGFVKPCRLVCEDGAGKIFLRAPEIRYRLLRGRLTKLWYKNDYGEYVRSQNNEDTFVIDTKSLLMQERDEYISAKTEIKAIASCGLLNMPESEAVIRFRLEKVFFKENGLDKTNQQLG